MFGGVNSGAVQEDGIASASGTITAADRDTGDATILPTAMASIYGTFIADASGNWTYALKNTSTAVQSLNAGQTVFDTFSVTTAGGASQTVTIAVTGVNDRPTLSSSAKLLTLAEDASPTTGPTVATLFGGRFGDVDSGASLGGVLVTANAATAGQGTWLYKAVGGAWTAIPTSGLSTTHALALDADTQIKFVPALNYNGTPGVLTVYAADDQYAGGFSTSAGAVLADTGAEGVSVAGVSLSITISAVNDAPTFSPATDVAVGFAESALTDSVADLTTAAGAALSCWIHGSWYLLSLPVAGLLLGAASLRRKGFLTTARWCASMARTTRTACAACGWMAAWWTRWRRSSRRCGRKFCGRH